MYQWAHLALADNYFDLRSFNKNILFIIIMHVSEWEHVPGTQT